MMAVARGKARRLTIGALMAAVALAAIAFNLLRPVTQSEAARIADRRFRALPGSGAWAGRYEARPRFTDGGNGRHYWIVNFVDLASNEPLAQVSLDPRGRLEATVVAFPGAPSPVPAEYLPGPIPPPMEGPAVP
ncbi:MAG: hypothetical protein U0800_07500 [Isosphaeraceae bacterium]